MQQDRLSDIAEKNRRLGILLTLVVIGLFAYSFVVIRHRGQLPEPKNLTFLQRMLRGL
jgi:hypothetical protein